MKKLLFVVVAFSLLGTGASIAEPTHPNEVGLYTTPDGYGATSTFGYQVPVDVYLVLTKPTDANNGDAPYPSINYFEVTLRFDPVPNNNLFKLGDTLPPRSINIGDSYFINQGYLEYIVGIDPTSPVPVVDEAAVLIHFVFMNVSPEGFVVYLEPTENPSISGEMAFQSEEGEYRVLYSVAGSHDLPVFGFGSDVVAVENESFGSVKALYR